MKTISKNTKNDISKLSFIERFELKLKTKKTKLYSKTQYKLITWCIIKPNNEIKTPNKQRKKIIDFKKQYDKSCDIDIK